MEKLPILTGEKVVLRPITDADTDNIVRWRNTPSVRDNFIFRQTFTPEMHRNWLKTKVATGEVVQYIIVDKAADTAVPSTASSSARRAPAVRALEPRLPACSPISASPRCTCTASVCACLPRTPLPAAATPLPALWRKAPSVTWSVWTASTATWSLWQKLHNNV